MENTPTGIIGALAVWVVPVVAIISLTVLLALHDIDSTAGLTLIAALAGVHGGAALKN